MKKIFIVEDDGAIARNLTKLLWAEQYQVVHAATRQEACSILMSVGATEKQLRHSVLFEGFCVGCMGIPVGICIGIPAVKLVLMLTEHNFSNILYADVPLKLHISGAALAVAVLISFLTILLSAWLPARKAVQTPIMECIRQTNEVQISKKAVKISRVVESQLNLEGSLALKNFKEALI